MKLQCLQQEYRGQTLAGFLDKFPTTVFWIFFSLFENIDLQKATHTVFFTLCAIEHQKCENSCLDRIVPRVFNQTLLILF